MNKLGLQENSDLIKNTGLDNPQGTANETSENETLHQMMVLQLVIEQLTRRNNWTNWNY